MDNPLSKDAQKLLDKLIADATSGLLVHERILNPKNASIYIYNLFIGDYRFSYSTFKEILTYLQDIECQSTK